jgi:hypothetical protein
MKRPTNTQNSTFTETKTRIIDSETEATKAKKDRPNTAYVGRRPPQSVTISHPFLNPFQNTQNTQQEETNYPKTNIANFWSNNSTSVTKPAASTEKQKLQRPQTASVTRLINLDEEQTRLIKYRIKTAHHSTANGRMGVNPTGASYLNGPIKPITAKKLTINDLL